MTVYSAPFRRPDHRRGVSGHFPSGRCPSFCRIFSSFSPGFCWAGDGGCSASSSICWPAACRTAGLCRRRRRPGTPLRAHGRVICGGICRRFSSPAPFPGGWGGKTGGDLAALACGTVLVYAFGVPWLKLVAGLDWTRALALGMVPFLPGDGLKIAAAVAVARVSSAGDAAPGNPGRGVAVTGGWILDSGYWILDAGFWD